MKLQTIKNLMEEPFTGTVNVDASARDEKVTVDPTATAKDAKDHTKTSKTYDHLDMEGKIAKLRQHHGKGAVALEALRKAAAGDKKTMHTKAAVEMYEQMKNLSIAITRQLEREEEELQGMLTAEPQPTDNNQGVE